MIGAAPLALGVLLALGGILVTMSYQKMWDKYELANFTDRKVSRNTFILSASAFSQDAPDLQSPEGAYLWKDISVAILQRRGVVFMACHNAIWELAERIVSTDQNPDHLAVDVIAAELTNHLIPDVILTPGIVATLVKLQLSGFAYAR